MPATTQRATFVTALAKVDDAIKAARQPVGARAVFLAIEEARESWAAWSPARRPQARADHEAVLKAELAHARADFLRLVHKHHAEGLFDMDDPRVDPSEYYRLPRERAAAAALNALMHASVTTRIIGEQIRGMRRQLTAALDVRQTADYRENWSNVYRTAHADLTSLLRRRRRDWQRALILIAEYQKETV